MRGFFEQFGGQFFNEEILNIIVVRQALQCEDCFREKMHQFDSFFYKNDHSSNNRVVAILKTMIMLAVNLCIFVWNQSDQILTLFAF